jgi:hypothetical protein
MPVHGGAMLTVTGDSSGVLAVSIRASQARGVPHRSNPTPSAARREAAHARAI